ncbi:MAG: HAD-IIIA family hydrolase [Mariprofundaceae bacterium]
MLPKAVILDRDGVINFDSPDYILAPDQWHPIPGSLEAIAWLNEAGIPVAIASNQSALGRGMLDEATFDAIIEKMTRAIEAAGGIIAHLAFCPHAPEAACDCRKPKPGLIDECLAALGLADAPASALMIGDSLRDVQAALAAGVPAWLVQSGYGDAAAILEAARRLDPEIPAFADLAHAVRALLGEASC